MTATLEDVANKAFNYIIIGGGTAGLTLAARLSEDPEKSVLVLEAGDANVNHPDLLRPASFGSHFSSEVLSWQHKTIKQKFANNRESPWNRGKGLGGSSGINFLCYLKPPASDINDFERLGNKGWNWANFEKYLARTEGFVEPSAEVQKKNKFKFDTWKIGREGPLKLAYPAKIDEAERMIQQTFLNGGFPVAPHPLSGDPTGAFFAPCTYDPLTHTRSYATTAFYLPNKDRANLTVLVNAAVHRVILENSNEGYVATGVEFEYAGNKHRVTAKDEVISCAGTLQTPHILEQSGIGNAKILKNIDIPVKVDLPGVGENVQEHLFVGVSWELREDVPFDTLDLLRDPAIAAEHLKLHAQGLGIHTTGIIGFNFSTLDKVSSQAEAIYQSIQEMIDNMDPKTTRPGLIEQYKVAAERFKPGSGSPGCEFISFPGFLSGPKPPLPGKRYATIFVAVNHCFSRGTIHSLSSDPAQDPEFDPRYFERDVDLRVHLELIKWARKMADIAPFKDMIVDEYNPGPEVQTDEQLSDWLKATFSTTWHTAGSCSMLPRDKDGVVDNTLKVYGTKNLRVVDLSVVPLHIAAHPQSIVYAVAEQGADIIKGKFPA